MSRIRCGAANIPTRSTWSSRIDSSKLYLSVLHPSPAASGVMVVDTATWTIKKEIQGIGPDLQTPAITYDGKYVLAPFSGFQRLSSGIAVIDTRDRRADGHPAEHRRAS